METTNETRTTNAAAGTKNATSSRVTIRGKLGKNAETKFTASGSSVTKFSISSGADGWTEIGPDQWEDGSRAQRIIIWDCATPLINLLVAGAEVEVTGRIKFDDYVGKDGKERTSSEVTAWSVRILAKAPAAPAPTVRSGDMAIVHGGQANGEEDPFGEEPIF